ncbi:MAG: tRNA (adenosine(37)-N6)-threonylcarbamoyltransferase complex dimerization subunit type 1 TsaB, partial [Proteobacteria bacterium]|nr:tRNA (adenosine(37)-N6)-threonylcarbamoyltransferase complex dimerization subunit type 1 TsaB [Pseudomonadota bacterium]
MLAIESAGREAGVALVRGDELLAAAVQPGGAPHAESLLALVDRCLATAETALAQLNGIAVSVGPGSFTGLRIGVATAKGLFFRDERPVIPVSTLAAHAWHAWAGRAGACVALQDAQRGEVYAGVYRCDGPEPRAVGEEGLFTPAALAKQMPEAAALAGPDVERFAAGLRDEGARFSQAPPPAGPLAETVARLGARALARGE